MVGHIAVVAMAASAIATTGFASLNCTGHTLPPGMCWSNAPARISTAPGTTTQACCATCSTTPTCQTWVYWTQINAGHNSTQCTLFRNAAPAKPCGDHAVFVVGSLPPPPPSPPPPPPPPAPPGAKDVLLIAVDDMRPELQGRAYGCTHMKTPNFDAFAADAVVFDHAYVAVAWCSPSRTALLTSRRPDTSRTWSVVPSEYWRERGGNFTTLPQVFKEHGYLTAGIGKIFHPGPVSRTRLFRWSWFYWIIH
eukprot:m.216940 g.216940  ORF g.216940 m.216940 type:complete len:251 (-) comp28705_c0_seq1:664-1416(-)